MKKHFNPGILIVVGAFILCLVLLFIFKPAGDWGSLYVIIPVMAALAGFLLWSTLKK